MVSILSSPRGGKEPVGASPVGWLSARLQIFPSRLAFTKTKLCWPRKMPSLFWRSIL